MKKLSIIALIVLTSQISISQKEALPSQRQLNWEKLSYYAFTHFGPNTFTDLEWGHGTETEDIFNPTALDCEQWVKTFKQAGIEGVIITAKHHDGFCLWPSKYSKHTVRESKWKNGKGDVLRELSNACKKYGLKFGLYLSPWDRNHPDYGTEKYNQVFVNMLNEVLTNYGPIFEVWFDGANGEGPNGKKQVYDFELFNSTVRKLQPNSVIFSDVGPDIRWVGNERGFAGETNWSTINNQGWYAGKAGIEKQLNEGHENGFAYQPTEIDVSIRPGWFFHEKENEKVKSADELMSIYLKSVGRNGNLLLNIPPDMRGRIHKNDSLALLNFKEKREELLGKKLKINPEKIGINGKKSSLSKALVDGNNSTFLSMNQEKELTIEMDFGKNTSTKGIQLREYLPKGQHIKSFEIEGFNGENWTVITKGTTIGNRRILTWNPLSINKLRIKILDAFDTINLSGIEVY
ncbi:MAG: alpha-L-fucosidase [Bacteroidota bacterium]